MGAIIYTYGAVRFDLQADIKQRPTKLRRRAEHLRHKRKEWTGTPFYSNLYSFVIGFCDQEKSGSLKEPTKDPEEHLRKTYSDEWKHKPFTIPMTCTNSRQNTKQT